jgi:competence ComEA-like helix-hairpin-helix protein
MNEHIKDYFYFSRGEKNGLIVLLAILIILIAIPSIINIFPDKKTPLNEKFTNEINAFAQSVTIEETPDYQNRLDQYIIERYDSLKLFHFNPNSSSNDNFKKLGLTDKQISTINNYIEKGGKFTIKDDFRKIYGIRQAQYQILKPFILLPDKKQNIIDEQNQFYSAKINKQEIDSIFVFDPNKASNQDFSKLGFSEKQINTIRNYQNKGGKFTDKEDFKKIYGISDEQYLKLEPYLFIKKEVKKEIIANNLIIEINAATSDQLIEIKGIGKYTADEIIKYRNKLGGFVSLEQLLEIKSIKRESYEYFVKSLSINPKLIKKISLNFSEIEDFTAHPYFNYYQAKEIVKFRSTNGPFKEIKQLLDNKILLETSYKKIKPYLSIN